MDHLESSKLTKDIVDEGNIINPFKETGPDFLTLDIIVTS